MVASFYTRWFYLPVIIHMCYISEVNILARELAMWFILRSKIKDTSSEVSTWIDLPIRYIWRQHSDSGYLIGCSPGHPGWIDRWQ